MRWFCLLLVVPALACSRENPAFNDSNAIPMNGTDGDDGVSDAGSSPPMVTTDSASESMTSSASQSSGDPTDTDGFETGGEDTTTAGSEETGSLDECPPFEEVYLDITLWEEEAGDLAPNCAKDTFIYLGGHVAASDADSIEIAVCPGGDLVSCYCETPEFFTLTVPPVPLLIAEINACVELYVDHNGMNGPGCAWEAFALRFGDNEQTTMVGANATSIGTPWGDDYDVSIDENVLCGPVDCEGGVPHPGVHDIVASGDRVAEGEEGPVDFSGEPFTLTNWSSHVTGACELSVAWTAVSVPQE